ncbi:zinc-binding alcohol dehydrogenase family protein, partial [Synechococcus sp. AH-736-A19]|nr:zinc-binding alcohol dehydrogenase family protein [Synechococcus sp. AH-736-A19]
LVLGYDASGIVVDVGSSVSRFKIGDEVFYAGQINRQGSNGEYHIVDERIVGQKPSSLSHLEAAAYPLVSLTAWEILLDCFHLEPFTSNASDLLVIGGAGGVSSMVIQLAKSVFGMNVVATSSRPESLSWVQRMGADDVINHRLPLDTQLSDLHFSPRYVACLNQASSHFKPILKSISPFGHVAIIDEAVNIDTSLFKQKSVSLSWEYVFTKSLYQTSDIFTQGEFLDLIAGLIDRQIIHSITGRRFEYMNPVNLQIAHELQLSGQSIGKTVLGPWCAS